MNDELVNVFPQKEDEFKDFKPLSWRKKIDFIKRLVTENNMLVSILGEEKSGKTTFGTMLRISLPSKMKGYMIAASSAFDKSIFIRELAVLLDMEGEESIARLFEKINSQKSSILVIVDDAQSLSECFIDELLAALKKQGPEGYVHVCLISDFSLVPTLNKFAKSAFKDMIHSIEMGPLTEPETAAYLTQSLTAKGYSSNKITDQLIKSFYQKTGGHFVHINRQLPTFFSGLDPKSQKVNFFFKMDRQTRQLAAITSILVAVVGVGYVFKTPVTEHSYATVEIPPAPIQQVVEEKLTSAIPAYHVAAVRQVPIVTSLKSVTNENLTAEELALSETVAVVDKVVVAPKILKNNLPSIAWPTTAKKKGPVKSAVKKDPGYTIQLLASHRKKDLQYFVHVHQIKTPSFIYKTRVEGKDWYILTIGAFQERQQAQKAVAKLPKDIGQFKPWIRAISGIKEIG